MDKTTTTNNATKESVRKPSRKQSAKLSEKSVEPSLENSSIESPSTSTIESEEKSLEDSTKESSADSAESTAKSPKKSTKGKSKSATKKKLSPKKVASVTEESSSSTEASTDPENDSDQENKASNSSKGLIIVESPAKARTLEKYSKGKFKVIASMGHVRDLPKSRLGIDVDNNYEPSYITIRGKKKIIEALRKSAMNAKKILLASDPDREGEAIAWHLANLLKVKDPLRVELHEITQNAFNEALQNPRPIDMNLVNAQQARRVLDRLVGYNLSPLLWRKITSGLSAGRVQSVAVKLICDRQREIDAFIPEEYWTIAVLASKLDQEEKDAFEAILLKKKKEKIRIPDQQSANTIIDELKKNKFIVKSITKKDQKKSPPPPFRTSTLQQEAFRKLGFKAKRTMSLAQELYEGLDVGKEGPVGLITYMRTDSVRISEVAKKDANEFILATFGKEYCGDGRKYTVKGKTQDAHEAIRPTDVNRTPESLKPYLKRDHLRLYKLIWERFVASQMSPCILETTTVDIDAGDYLFRAGDSKVKFPGFARVYGYHDEENSAEIENSENDEIQTTGKKKPLPPLSVGEELKIHKYLPAQHFTQPPPAYTEASLIKALEEKGIGRPSTYAPIVETIQKREYVVLQDKKFRPTELGFKVNDMLTEYFPEILDVDFTAGMETKLDRIEEGKEDWVDVIDKFYKPFTATLSDAEQKISRVPMEPEKTDEVCDKCGKPMVIRRGRFGKFIACSGYPECKNTKPIVEDIGVLCPEEGCQGKIIEKRSKKGKLFYGCSNYPTCKFASWNKPINQRCNICGKIMVLRFSKQGRTYISCIDPECNKKAQQTVSSPS